MKKLDTRQKIRPASSIPHLQQVFSSDETLLVRTAMDPLTLAHARRLAELAAATGRSIVVLLEDPPQPLLPQDARAELAAALACVSVVVTGLDAARLAELPAGRVIDELDQDLARRRQLIEAVHARHSATS